MSSLNKIQVGESLYNLGDIYKTVAKNAGAHNSLYRGEDITNLWYDGTLSEQIANGTFDDIFIGDYIIGNTSGTKYLVADINYRLCTGDTECTTPHILMIPENVIGNAKMNDTDITTGAYVGSKMYTEYLAPSKEIIRTDFSSEHILVHRNYLANSVSNGYEDSGAWYDSDIELMNECMIYGSNIFHNITGTTYLLVNNTIDNTQLSIFRLNRKCILALDSDGLRNWYYLRDVAASNRFTNVASSLRSNPVTPSSSCGIRPAFLIY